MNILLIEDDPDVFSTLESVFTAFYAGSRLARIASGAEFENGAWRKENWHLVVLDLMLPGMTGFDICRALRRHPPTQGAPILAFTGYDTPTNRERILQAGANAYLSKPFEVTDFVRTVKTLLGPGRASGAGAGGRPDGK